MMRKWAVTPARNESNTTSHLTLKTPEPGDDISGDIPAAEGPGEGADSMPGGDGGEAAGDIPEVGGGLGLIGVVEGAIGIGDGAMGIIGGGVMGIGGGAMGIGGGVMGIDGGGVDGDIAGEAPPPPDIGGIDIEPVGGIIGA
ncbi:PREDICTED: glycine-rich cell wall structural protein [Tarenaya hassleriana]|uniref:glycine-rich cell wall structural protein n=1 Tax=Tarenaya hassleriana TaxID=28532 RepID=UPI0008FCEBB7|nr:PREDICTED: glycine-rich cell wall structural protein [Tarenaya hassleriana]